MQFSFVYIVTNKKDGVLYIGVTSDLVKRITEHRTKTFKWFTSRYNCDQLVYFETYEDISEAIYREKQIKKWSRAWKVRIIEETNPDWNDLYMTLV